MSINNPFQGSLFANDFLCESIVESPDWRANDDMALDTLEASVRDVFNLFPTRKTPNESQTEEDLIWPVFLQLGWTASLRQQNLSARGREDVPDGLLFTDAAAKERANSFTEEWKRYEFGLAVVESKRWLRPARPALRTPGRGKRTLDSDAPLPSARGRSDNRQAAMGHPYQRRKVATLLSRCPVRLGAVLRSRTSRWLLDLPGHNDGLFALTGS